MNKLKYKHFVLKCDIYPFDIAFCFGEKESMFRSLKRYFSKEDIDEIKSFTYAKGKTIMMDGGQSIIWVHAMPDNIYDLAILQHEIYHVTCFILKKVGIVFSDDSDEAFAYMIQWMTCRVYEKLGLKIKIK